MKIAWFCIPAHGHTNRACGGAKEAVEFLEKVAAAKEKQ